MDVFTEQGPMTIQSGKRIILSQADMDIGLPEDEEPAAQQPPETDPSMRPSPPMASTVSSGLAMRAPMAGARAAPDSQILSMSCSRWRAAGRARAAMVAAAEAPAEEPAEKPGTLVVSAKQAAEVYIQGQFADMAPVKRDLPPGRYAVSIVAELIQERARLRG